MKPHPRIRKTIKWGGAVVTLSLVALWVTTGYRSYIHYSPNSGWLVGPAGGGVTFQQLGAGVQGPAPGWNAFSQRDFRVWWLPRLEDTRQSWSLFIPLWPLMLISTAAGMYAWRLDALGRRRARIGLCPKCSYDRAGIAGDAKCPECGAAAIVSAPKSVGNFPYFVLIGDERTFVRANRQHELNHFEQADIEELPHWAWDTGGRKYVLVWAPSVGPVPKLVADDGIADFRTAVAEYQGKLTATRTHPPLYGRCEPDEFLAALRDMENSKGG